MPNFIVKSMIIHDISKKFAENRVYEYGKVVHYGIVPNFFGLGI